MKTRAKQDSATVRAEATGQNRLSLIFRRSIAAGVSPSWGAMTVTSAPVDELEGTLRIAPQAS